MCQGVVCSLFIFASFEGLGIHFDSLGVNNYSLYKLDKTSSTELWLSLREKKITHLIQLSDLTYLILYKLLEGRTLYRTY